LKQEENKDYALLGDGKKLNNSSMSPDKNNDGDGLDDDDEQDPHNEMACSN
jgi:hypothetical protein